MSVSFGLLCAVVAAAATGGNVAPFNREGREAVRKSLDPREKKTNTLRLEFFLQMAREEFRVTGRERRALTPRWIIVWKERKLPGLGKTEYLMGADF